MDFDAERVATDRAVGRVRWEVRVSFDAEKEFQTVRSSMPMLYTTSTPVYNSECAHCNIDETCPIDIIAIFCVNGLPFYNICTVITFNQAYVQCIM